LAWVTAVSSAPARTAPPPIGNAPPSPAGPIDDSRLAELRPPPEVPLARSRQILAFSAREIEFVFRWRRELGEVFRFHGIIPGSPTITSHPDHARSLFTANPKLVPSLTAESPLLPIVGANSVLTANGARHLRQRKLLLPPFHGEAIQRYMASITDIAEREIDGWPVGRPVSLAPKMQAITLDVITSGILGISGRPQPGTPEHGLVETIKRLTRLSTTPLAKLAEFRNLGHREAVGLQRRALAVINRHTYGLIERRRADPDLDGREDILSLIMRAQTEDGEALSDHEVRDELLTLILAGFETTANSLAWSWERLVRGPDAYAALREGVRSDEDADGHVERVILETMRNRPVIPAVGRRVQAPWQLGDYGVPAGRPITVSVLLVHHREDVYPDPFAYRPDRWLARSGPSQDESADDSPGRSVAKQPDDPGDDQEGEAGRRTVVKQPDDPGDDQKGEAGRRTVVKPGSYEWIPFGGGTRRCLGAALAMAEQRVVLRAMARRLDLAAVDPEPERAQHRNVTMIPARGARVIIRARRS
jgi:cytochrome P450